MNELFSFGVWVRQRRKALDLTQEALATQIGCAAATVRRIEADARRPSRQLAARLADALSLAPEQREPFVQAARAQLPVDQLAAPTHNLRALALPTYSRHANLPAQLTPLIGRPQELEQVAGLLRRADVRLVVLLGPGGIGKTRLAIEAATIAADLFRDGVVFVPLAAVNDANLILSSVADALKLYPHHDNEAGAQVQRYLQGRELLLVLDNVEQFVAGATVIADLASSAPGIKILMTSRVRLNLHAEWIVDVEGLPYPHDETRESLEDFAATGLFLQRARRAQSHFAVDEYNRTAIIRICTLLHGMPLGIELAAAWVRALTCQAILREIERGLHVLATTQQAVPERHRSVYATFEHSWRLLAAREQQAFSALTVFRGGFQRDAALAITDCSAEQLARLADHSLLHVTAEGRFDMHELMRQFVIDTLQARAVGHPIHVEQHAARQPTQRHCQYYLELLADQEAALRGDAPQNAVALLQPEIDNMRQAWQSAIERDAWQLLWRCLPAWARLYRLRGYYHEAQVLLEQALERLPALAGVALERDRARFKGQLLVCLAETLIMRASYRDARRRAEAATALATSADDPGLQGRALATLGTIHHLNREFDHALAQHQRAYTLLQQHGDARWTAQILLQIAKTHEYTHHWDQALAMQHEALAMFQTLRDQRGIATS